MAMRIANMPSTNGALMRNALTLIGFLAILSLLAAGHIAATFLIMLPMAFVIFGKRQDRPTRPPGDGSSHSMEP
jgi:hypothetical protein